MHKEDSVICQEHTTRYFNKNKEMIMGKMCQLKVCLKIFIIRWVILTKIRHNSNKIKEKLASIRKIQNKTIYLNLMTK
jgi:hypothetical protein